MAVKLVLCDLDGTLLNSRKQLPKDLFPLVEQLHARGVRFAPASGRQYFNLREQFAPVADELVYISENGGMVCDGSELVSFVPMPREQVIRAVEHCRQQEGIDLILSLRDGGYYENDQNPVFLENMAYYYARRIYAPDLLEVARTQEVCKIALFSKGRAEKHILPAFEPLRDTMEVVLSGTDWVDLMRPGLNKGDAVGVLCERFGIGREECMAFGDYLNDLELLGAVGHPYAMANAHPALRTAGKLCPSNDEDGVCRTLRVYFDLTTEKPVLQ